MITLVVFLLILRVTEGLEQRTCVGGNVDIGCPTWDHVLVFEDAVYGVLPGGNCGEGEAEICQDSSAFTTLFARCGGYPKCRFSLEHEDFAGLCPESDANLLLVTYRCISEDDINQVCTSNQESLGSKGYLSSPQYPAPFPTNVDCALQLQPPPGMVLNIELTLLDLATDAACGDVLLLTDLQQGQQLQYCGVLTAESRRFLTFSTVEISFISSDEIHRSPRGFLLYYTIEMRPDDSWNSTLEGSGDADTTDIDTEFFTTTYLSTPKATSSVAPTARTTKYFGWGRHSTISTTTSTTTATTATTTATTPTTPTTQTTHPSTTTTTTITPTTPTLTTTTRAETPFAKSPTTTAQTATTSIPSTLVLDSNTTITSTSLAPSTTEEPGLSKIACTGNLLRLSCPSNQFIVIEKAQYGHRLDGRCGTVAEESTPCVSDKALHKAAKACSGKESCEILVAKDIANQECAADYSALEVTYNCVEGNLLFKICGSRAHSKQIGYIASQKYPNAYDKKLKCEREIRPPEGYIVQITLLDLEMEARRDEGCYDFVTIRDPDDPIQTFQYCGDILRFGEPERTLMLHKAEIIFRSDGSKNLLKGFLLRYEVVLMTSLTTATSTPKAASESSVTTSSAQPTTQLSTGLFTTPTPAHSEGRTWTEDGATHTDVCKDSIFAGSCGEGYAIAILFATYGTHETSSCSSVPQQTCPVQEVADDVNDQCSGRRECAFRVDQESVTSDCSNIASLLVKYKCIPDTDIKNICSNDQLMSEGFLSSPEYPNNYDNGLHCTRQLVPVSPDAVITVTVLDLNTHARTGSGCYDYLLLNDENDLTKFYYYCGSLKTTDSPVVENFTSLAVEFRADDVPSDRRGFLLHYKVHAMNGSDVSLKYDLSTTTTMTTMRTTTTGITTKTDAPASQTQTGSSTQSQSTPATTPVAVVTPSYQTLLEEVCHLDVMVLSCDEADSVIVVEDAMFGIMTSSACYNSTISSDSCITTVTDIIAAECSGFSTCSFEVQDILSDNPCFAGGAGLKVEYFCTPSATNICDPNPMLGAEGFISSPSYPEGYPRRQDCTIEINQSNRGYPVAVMVRLYDLEVEARTSSSGCYDSLLVSEKNDPFHTYTICGSLFDPNENIPADLVFNNLQLTFYSNSLNPGKHKGFLLYYRITEIIDQETTTSSTDEMTTQSKSAISKAPTHPPSSSLSPSASTASTTIRTSSVHTSADRSSASTLASSTVSDSSESTPGGSTVSSTPGSRSMTPSVETVPTSPVVVEELSTLTVDMDDTTESAPVVKPEGKAAKSEGEGDGGSNAGVIAGVIVVVLLVVIALIVGVLLYIRYRRRRQKPTQKPGRQDLWANTSSPTQDATNEYTYVDMSSPDPALYDGSTVPLQAHESALSTPLYDDNKNRTFSRPHSGEPVLVVDGPADVIVNGNAPTCKESGDKNGMVPSAKPENNENDEIETSFAVQVESADIKPVTTAPPAPNSPAAELPENEPELKEHAPRLNAPELNATELTENQQEPDLSDNIVEPSGSFSSLPSECIAPPADFGESCTDTVENEAGSKDFADATKELQVDEDAPRVRRDRSRDPEEDLELKPNPYETQSFV